MNFAEKLKALRKEKNLTQPQLAKAIGVSKGAIGDVERGARNPSKDLAVKFANFFGTDALYWLNVDDNLENNHIAFRQLNETIDTLIQNEYITDLDLPEEIEKVIIESVKLEIFYKLKKKEQK